MPFQPSTSTLPKFQPNLPPTYPNPSPQSCCVLVQVVAFRCWPADFLRNFAQSPFFCDFTAASLRLKSVPLPFTRSWLDKQGPAWHEHRSPKYCCSDVCTLIHCLRSSQPSSCAQRCRRAAAGVRVLLLINVISCSLCWPRSSRRSLLHAFTPSARDSQGAILLSMTREDTKYCCRVCTC